jgi:hypothetical protein
MMRMHAEVRHVAFRANRDEAVRAIVVTTWGPPRHARCSIGSLTPAGAAPWPRRAGGAGGVWQEDDARHGFGSPTRRSGHPRD